VRTFILAVSIGIILAGCGGSGDGTGSGGAAGGAAGSGGTGGAGVSGGASGGGPTGSGGGTGTTGADNAEVPAEKTALFAYLKAGSYKGFAAESAPHKSSGPHSGNVRVFLNPVLQASLEAKNTVHPKGAAAVKELNVSGDQPGGWAVFVKTGDDSAGGDGLYWYETLNTQDGSNPPYEGQGVGICKGCHSGGTDFYLSEYPLQ
jgi:hypothetical protein